MGYGYVTLPVNNNLGYTPSLNQNFDQSFIIGPDSTVNNNVNIYPPNQGQRAPITWVGQSPPPINYGGIPYPAPMPRPMPEPRYNDPFGGQNLTPINYGANRGPEGSQYKTPGQLEFYADTIADSTYNTIIAKNTAYEFQRRTDPNARLAPGPYSNLTNKQFYQEGVEIRNASFDNANDAYGLLKANAGRNDPALRMSFERDLANLGATTFAVQNMEQRGWNTAANTNGMTPRPAPNPTPLPLYLNNPQAGINNNGINNNGVNNIGVQNVYPPYSTSNYITNYNTAQTNPTYANYVVYGQPAWLN